MRSIFYELVDNTGCRLCTRGNRLRVSSSLHFGHPMLNVDIFQVIERHVWLGIPELIEQEIRNR